MRKGHNPYKQMLENNPSLKFVSGYSSTTALGGMVRLQVRNVHSFLLFSIAV
jgi:hypothetical protein